MVAGPSRKFLALLLFRLGGFSGIYSLYFGACLDYRGELTLSLGGEAVLRRNTIRA